MEMSVGFHGENFSEISDNLPRHDEFITVKSPNDAAYCINYPKQT